MRYLDVRKTGARLREFFDEEGFEILLSWARKEHEKGYEGPYGWSVGGCWTVASALEVYFKRYLPEHLIDIVGIFQDVTPDPNDPYYRDYPEDFADAYRGKTEWDATHAMLRITGSHRGDYYLDSNGAKTGLKTYLRKDYGNSWKLFSYKELAQFPTKKRRLPGMIEVISESDTAIWDYGLPRKRYYTDIVKAVMQVEPVFR